MLLTYQETEIIRKVIDTNIHEDNRNYNRYKKVKTTSWNKNDEKFSLACIVFVVTGVLLGIYGVWRRWFFSHLVFINNLHFHI